MLNGLSVLMFGKKSAEQSATTKDENAILNCKDGAIEKEIDENDDGFNVDDDDWILINKEEKLECFGSEADVMSKSECSDFEVMTMPSTRASSCSSVARIAEWNLLPPPCFNRSNSHTATIASQDQYGSACNKQDCSADMEISVFENLLIEHPSLSVYCRFPVSSTAVVKQQTPTSPVYAKENNANVVEPTPAGNNAVTMATVYREKKALMQHNTRLTVEQQQKLHCNNKLITISEVGNQQRCEIMQKSRTLSAGRLRRNNLLIRHKCYTKALPNLQ